MTTGQRIRAARKNKGMTQAELAEKLNIPFQSVSQWERDIRKPKIETVQKIADALGVTVSYLQGYETIDAALVVSAVENKDYREVERILDLPPGSIQPLDPDEEKRLRSQIDEEKQRTGINLNKLHLSMKILHPKFSEDDFLLHQALLKQFSGLNAEGQQKAVERVEELTEIPKYQRQPPQNAPTTLSGGTDTTSSKSPPEGTEEGTENK